LDLRHWKRKLFTITQETEFDDEMPIGNEITITINDETSMVKDQTEWLINYKMLRDRLFRMGFVKVYNSVLDKDEAKHIPDSGLSFQFHE